MSSAQVNRIASKKVSQAIVYVSALLLSSTLLRMSEISAVTSTELIIIFIGIAIFSISVGVFFKKYIYLIWIALFTTIISIIPLTIISSSASISLGYISLYLCICAILSEIASYEY